MSFRFPGADSDALEHISFTAKPGETTAIIGSTGCGKSTLLNLIPRFYDEMCIRDSVGSVFVQLHLVAAGQGAFDAALLDAGVHDLAGVVRQRQIAVRLHEQQLSLIHIWL